MSHMPRRLGLTPSSLIKSLHPNIRRPNERPRRPKSPEDIHAPPIDSDDEAEDSETLSESRGSPGNARGGAESSRKPNRGDIKKQDFGKKSLPISQQQPASRSQNPSSGRQKGSKGIVPENSTCKRRSSPSDDDETHNQQPVHSRPVKRGAPSLKSPEVIDHDMKGLMRRHERSIRNKVTFKSRTLGRKPSPKLVVPDLVSPSPEPEPRHTSLQIPPALSPSPERKKVSLITTHLSPASPSRKRKRARTAARLELEPDRRAQSAMLKLPDLDGEDVFASPDVRKERSPTPLGGGDDITKEPLDVRPIMNEELCPMCYQPVERELLRSFSKGKTLTMRQQMKFCALHKARSAEDTWKKRGYPSIDWAALGGRLRRHHTLLRRIIDGEESHYRTDLAEKLAAGQERTLRKTERSLAPGYYGNRGLRLMSEHIIQHFSETLRVKAVDDHVISGRGTTVFVSKVLVPELATRLIMEDMSVGLVEARDILSESVGMGDLLQDDVGDGEIDVMDAVEE